MIVRSLILKNKESAEYGNYFSWGYGLRTDAELYDVIEDPFQLNNLADSAQYQDLRKDLENRLNSHLLLHNDPRSHAEVTEWDTMAWVGSWKFPEFKSMDHEDRVSMFNRKYG